jgi:hypothetical protein
MKENPTTLAYNEERALILSAANHDRTAYRLLAPKVSSRLRILIDTYKFRENVPIYHSLYFTLQRQAYPEYQSLNSRVLLLIKQQEVLHAEALNIAPLLEMKRINKWRGLFPRIDSFYAIQQQLNSDIEYTHVVFDNTPNSRPHILHDLATGALRGISWDETTVPPELMKDWRLVRGMAKWQGNFQKTTIFDLRDAENRIRQAHI